VPAESTAVVPADGVEAAATVEPASPTSESPATPTEAGITSGPEAPAEPEATVEHPATRVAARDRLRTGAATSAARTAALGRRTATLGRRIGSFGRRLAPALRRDRTELLAAAVLALAILAALTSWGALDIGGAASEPAPIVAGPSSD
jgi:hypothetical protein